MISAIILLLWGRNMLKYPWMGVGEGMEGLSKQEKRLVDNSVVIVGGGV